MKTCGILAVWAAVLMVGCGGDSGGSSSAPPPSGAVSQAQKADVASAAAEETTEIATEAVVESGAPGATSSKSGGSSKPLTSINYQASVTLTVDLDAPAPGGGDAHPNATGVFSVSAAGTITGDASAGHADYSCTVTWLTDGIFTDPVCGAQATVAAGSTRTFSCSIDWSYTDDLNWSVSAASDLSGSGTVSLSHGGTTWTATGSVERHATLHFSRSAGAWTFSAGLNGLRVFTITDGVETHLVTITVSALDHIVIEVDGVSYGPYTLAQIRAVWRFDCDG
jgi:hypothetical protein